MKQPRLYVKTVDNYNNSNSSANNAYLLYMREIQLVGKISADSKKVFCLGEPCEIMGLAIGRCSH